MSSTRITNFLLLIVAILLTANLLRPMLAPATAHADDETATEEFTAITGAGRTCWILKGNKVYYILADNEGYIKHINRPEELPE
jgi:hypothetical protein